MKKINANRTYSPRACMPRGLNEALIADNKRGSVKLHCVVKILFDAEKLYIHK